MSVETKQFTMPVGALIGNRWYAAGETADVPVDRIPALTKAAATAPAPAGPAGDAADAESSEGDSESAGTDTQAKATGPQTPLTDLFAGKTLGLLHDAGLATVADVQAQEDLTAIKGIGEQTALTIATTVQEHLAGE